MCFHRESLFINIFYPYFLFSHLFIHIFIFIYPKNHVSTIDKGFLIFKRVWKHLIGSFYSHGYLLPFIDHFCFLNLKIPKNYLLILSFKLPPCRFDLD